MWLYKETKIFSLFLFINFFICLSLSIGPKHRLLLSSKLFNSQNSSYVTGRSTSNYKYEIKYIDVPVSMQFIINLIYFILIKYYLLHYLFNLIAYFNLFVFISIFFLGQYLNQIYWKIFY